MSGFNSYHPYLFPPESTVLVPCCFSVLPVEDFSPASLLNLSSGLSVVAIPYGLTKETKFLSTTDLYCLLLSCICCSPVKSKQDLSRPPSHPDAAWHLCLHARSRCCKAPAHPHIQGSCHQLTPPQHCCLRRLLTHPKRRGFHHLCPIYVITLNQPAGLGMGFYTTFTVGVELQFCFSIASDISQVL